MIQLALLGADKEVAAWLEVAPRLREAGLAAITEINELDSDAFDAVVICTHAGLDDNARFAAAHGKHLFVSTPPASAAEATAWMQQSQTQNVQLMAGFSDRFLPRIQAIKQSLDTGQLGDPGLIRIHRWNSDADPKADVAADIDLAIWMFRALPTEVYAVGRRAADHEVEYLQVHLGFAAGGMGVIDLSNTLSSADCYYSLSLVGASGSAYADDHHNQQLLFRGEHPVALKTGAGQVARLAQLQEFADAINGQREPAVTSADARAALLVLEAAWQSIESGRTARLSGEHYEC